MHIEEVIRPKLDVDYQFFVVNPIHNQFLRDRFWDIAGLSEAEVELFHSILTNHTGEPFEVSQEQEMDARMLAHYGLVSFTELVEPVQMLANPTRIGILLYEYSTLRDMRTIGEFNSDGNMFAGKIFAPAHVTLYKMSPSTLQGNR